MFIKNKNEVLQKEIFIFFSEKYKHYYLSANQDISDNMPSRAEKVQHYKDFTEERKEPLLSKMRKIHQNDDFSVDSIICYSIEDCTKKIKDMQLNNYTKVGTGPMFHCGIWAKLPM